MKRTQGSEEIGLARSTKDGLSARGSSQVILSRELEQELAQRWVKHGDLAARDVLVRAQFRHVAAIARHYKHHTCATMSELIAEGNFGLVKALGKFDPDRGTRFATYAVYWIRSYISQYLMRSRSLVSSGVQSKTLAKIRRTREAIIRAGGEVDDVNEQVATRLALAPEKLHSFLERMEAHDVPWDATVEGSTSAFSGLDSGGNAEERLLAAENGERLSKAVSHVVSNLDPRERYVVEQRLMASREEALSLAEIGRRFGVSRERARQLELRALGKVRAGLARLSQDEESFQRPAA